MCHAADLACIYIEFPAHMCSVFSCIAGGLKFPLFWLLHSHRYTLIFIMAKVPLALDTGALAALLNVQDANVVTMVPALAQPAVQVPQAVNADQPVQQQAHNARQASEVCFCFFRSSLVSRSFALCFMSSFGCPFASSAFCFICFFFLLFVCVLFALACLASSFLSCYLFGLLVFAPVW